ncbi:DNA polymerase III subunit delta' [Aerococcus sp. HMSC10H05]|uniref:DNA polymerase III subunit delta' n=1 Tax=Aerococcus sp. HMSC10H05 TaxID=1581084 RepID=UPI0008A1D217|nr:DNA polymerase III subunit delta' [Aerococcus sp. HMSC10H05]OFU52788.1 DNA polymerase III subunit delta' [Aerococcus sp. HMSC10H05]
MAHEHFDIARKQADLTAMMDRVLINNRLGHAYIFEGMVGAGQEDMALYLAAYLNCLNPEDQGTPCGTCNHCRRILSADYPDVFHIEPDGNTIKIDQTRDLKERLSMSSLEGDNQIFIIHEAEKMTVNAANSLLKFIEEPHENVFIFLLTNNRDAILSTIVSRCQMIHFPQLNQVSLKALFEEAGIKPSMATTLTALTNDIDEAVALAWDEDFQQRLTWSMQWVDLIVKKDPRGLTMVASDWMKGPKGRADIIQALNLVAFHFHDLLYLLLHADQGQSNQDQMVFPNNFEAYQGILAKITVEEATKALHLVGQAQRMIQSNVSVQSAMEYMVLAYWKQ